MKHLRMLFGAVVWLTAIWLVWDMKLRTLIAGGAAQQPVASQLWNYATTNRRSAALHFDTPHDVSIGDPIFAWTTPTSLSQVGEVVGLKSTQDNISRAQVTQATAMFYANCPPLAQQSGLTYHRTPDSLAWVAATMLPPAKRRAVAEEIGRAFQEQQQVIVSQLRPIIQDALQDALKAVEADLQQALLNHRQEIQAIGGRYQSELIEAQVVPLVKQEIWPIVLKRGEPLANEIGMAIWERVSVWRFTWRYFSDLAPLTRGDRFAQEWRRFVRKEAVPVLETHTDDLIGMVKTVLSEISRNSKIQSAMRRNLHRMLNDPELQKTLWKVVREVVFDRPGLRRVMNQHWNSQRTREAFQVTAERLEPAAQRIGALLFGSPETGITPEFRQVLRNRILHKDRRWFVLVPSKSTDVQQSPNSEPTTFNVTPGPLDSTSPFGGPRYD